jgi:serine protease Do
MQQLFMKKIITASALMLAVPFVVLAQVKEEKDKKEKKDYQQIIITREGNVDVKTVIEIDGDKVKVNGKDVKDSKDVNVHVNKLKGANVFHWNADEGQHGWNFNSDELSMFTEDDNRAMLGVVTEGNDKGAEIQSITKESGAEKAGLKKGDVITKIGDKVIDDADDVTKAVRAQKPGEKINITYLRDGKEQKATAELGKWKGIKMNEMKIPMEGFNTVFPPEAPSMAYGNGSTFYFNNSRRLGLSIQDTEDGKGVKVLEVDEDGNAAKAGIKEGDVILSVDEKEIKGTDDISKIIRENKEKYNFNFKVQRSGKTQSIDVKIPKKLKTTDL